MDNRYKIIISNKRIYKEVELSNECRVVKVGSTKNCVIRLSKELFFEEFEIKFENNDSGWRISCEDNIYISLDGVMKLVAKELNHGDDLVIKYQESNKEVINIRFMFDFDFEKKDYDRVIDVRQINQVIIGGGNGCDICLKDELIGKDTVTLSREEGKYIITDNKSKYGVYVNGMKIKGFKEIRDCDFFSVIGYSFYLKQGELYTSKRCELGSGAISYYDMANENNHLMYPRFNRNTRLKSVVPKEKIDILDPPSPQEKPKSKLLMSLLPAFGMLALTVVLRGVMGSGGTFVIFSVCSMGMGIITSIMSIINEKKEYKKNIIEREVNYNNYILCKKTEITKLREEEMKILEDTYIPSNLGIKLVNDFSSELFDRACEDEDFLHVRIGTGDLISNRQINYKKQEKFETSDIFANVPEQVAHDFKYLKTAPIVVNLTDLNAIGIVGESNSLYEVMKIVALDICIRHYHNDVRLFLATDEEHSELIQWLRFLPHVQNEQLGIRNIICDNDSKNMMFEFLFKELSRRESAKSNYPKMVVFICNDIGLKKHPLSRYIKKAKELGFTFVFFEQYKEHLPMGCEQIITLDKNGESGEIINCSDSTQIIEFQYDKIEDSKAWKVVEKLSPVYCEEVSLEGSLTKNISLFELLNIISVEDIDLNNRWTNSEVYKSMAAPLGVKSKNEIVYLDLNEKHHGPHGLVAGTTGSGKSEILQSYILSMATVFHPYEVSFVIIDFKGGGMVNQFKDLPHLIGAITNIDGREINRSLLSIKAELRKRQALFAQYGVNHIDQYIMLYKKGGTKSPLPHLILIVDEFAELKVDQPEFMKELISAARIGRSLGVHLILATQKPSGVVDSQIWSNSKFKLCLKVQNKEDSNEVLKTPLAAEIKEPGRAYLQVGNNEIFDLFQSAYSGAPASVDVLSSKKSFSIYSVALSGRKSRVYFKKANQTNNQRETQLEAMVNYVKKYCEDNQIEQLPGICLPPLSENIKYLKRLHKDNNLKTVVQLGIYDDPGNQSQDEVVLDITCGNTLVIGAAQFGKTNLLQVIIRGIADNFTPNEVSIYILDFGSMALNVFEGLRHLGGVIVASNDEKLKNFMRMLRNEIKERKEIFSRIGITSFVSYKEAGLKDIGNIVILVDNFLALKELYPEYEDDILNLCREGIAVGISLIVTSQQTNGISYKYLSNFSNRICLYCNQGDEYGTLFDRCRKEPKNVPGRGLISINKTVYEYQTYLAFKGDKEIDRVAAIGEYIHKTNEQYATQQARKIPEVPQILDNNYVNDNFIQNRMKPYQVPVGIDYETVEFVTLDLAKSLLINITGREGSGKTNLIKVIFDYLKKGVFDYPTKAYIIDDYERQLNSFSTLGIVEKYTIDAHDFEFVLGELEAELLTRINIIQSMGYEGLEQHPLLLCIIQNNSLFDTDILSKNGLEIFKRILKNYRQLKVCFIFANVDNAPVSYNAPELLKIVRDSKIIFAFDDLVNVKLVEVSTAAIRQYKKLIELGDSYIITDKGIQKQKTIHGKKEGK